MDLTDLSAGTLIASLFVSSIGFGFFMYGKKQERVPQLAVGCVMVIYPYFVSNPLAMCSIAAALLLGLVLALRLES